MVVTVLVSFVIAIHTMIIIVRDTDSFPYWDMVAVFSRYFKGPMSTFFLFKDNEHLPFVAMPFFYVDMNLFEAVLLDRGGHCRKRFRPPLPPALQQFCGRFTLRRLRRRYGPAAGFFCHDADR